MKAKPCFISAILHISFLDTTAAYPRTPSLGSAFSRYFSNSISRTRRIYSPPNRIRLGNPPSSRLHNMGSYDNIHETSKTDTNKNNPLSHHRLPSPLILGSASFTRRLILEEMNIPFHILVRPIDEQSIGDRSNRNPEDLVLSIARAKMNHLIHQISCGDCRDELRQASESRTGESDGEREWIVLTGDQVVTCSDRILEKPTSVEEAKRFVRLYADHPPSTVGSVVLTHHPSGITVEGVDRATIYFKKSVCRTVSSADSTCDAAKDDTEGGLDLVDRLLEESAPILSCAGGLMIEHPLVKEHVERIDGTEDSVMGLSKALVNRLLGELKTKLDQER